MTRLALGLLAAALIAAPAQAAVTATATRTDDPTTITLTAKIDITVKRRLERKLFAEACGLPEQVLFCDAKEVSKRVVLHRGRNRKTVTFEVRRLRYHFVGVQVTGTPWDGYQMVPAPVDTVWFHFGRERAREVRPAPVAHDTLRDVGM